MDEWPVAFWGLRVAQLVLHVAERVKSVAKRGANGFGFLPKHWKSRGKWVRMAN
jgi:hypothetical protein